MFDPKTALMKRVSLSDLLQLDPKYTQLMEDQYNKKDVPEPEQAVADTEAMYSYALTLNICNNERINKKRWEDYTADKQEMILMKKLKSFARGCDATVTRVVYETCPRTGQRHLHARIICEDYIKSRYIELMNSRYKTYGYKTIKVDPIYSEPGWEQYLKKNE